MKPPTFFFLNSSRYTRHTDQCTVPKHSFSEYVILREECTDRPYLQSTVFLHTAGYHILTLLLVQKESFISAQKGVLKHPPNLIVIP
jgi:hypothetical protein